VQAALAGPHGQQAAAYVTLQSQLAETQTSLANHLSKIRDLEEQVQGHEATRHEVSQVKEQMEETKREMELLVANTRGRQQRVWEDDDESDEDDDTRSVATVMSSDEAEERVRSKRSKAPDLAAQNAELTAKVESMSAEIADVIQLARSLQTQHGEALSAVQDLTNRLGALETGFTSRVAEEVGKTEQKWESWKAMFEETHRRDRESWEAERERLRGVVREWEEASRRAYEEAEERELNEELSGEEDVDWKGLDSETPTFAQTRKARRRRPSHRATLAIDALKAVADAQGSSTPKQDRQELERSGPRGLKARKGNLPRNGSASTIRDDKDSSDSGKESGGTLREGEDVEKASKRIAQVSRHDMKRADTSADYHYNCHCRRRGSGRLSKSQGITRKELSCILYLTRCMPQNVVIGTLLWLLSTNTLTCCSHLTTTYTMVNYLREIVSGKKARFIDHETATNLDLVYVTDRILM
jgi:hypothetical protein